MAPQSFLQEENFNTFSFKKISSFHCLDGCGVFFPNEIGQQAAPGES